MRANPGLSAAVVAFVVLAVGAGIFGMPRAEKPRAQRGAASGALRGVAGDPDAPPARDVSRLDPPPAPATPEPDEVFGPAVPPSARGLALAYRYRTLPPGGESRYGWTVWLAGPGPAREGVEVVTYRMDPPAKNGGEFESRDRAAEGFPLFGHGPGGWFGVSATVRYRDGTTETLDRRVELPEPE